MMEQVRAMNYWLGTSKNHIQGCTNDLNMLLSCLREHMSDPDLNQPNQLNNLNFARAESPPPSVCRGAARPGDGQDGVHLRRGPGRRVRLGPLAAARELRRPQRRHHHLSGLHAPPRAQGAPQGM